MTKLIKIALGTTLAIAAIASPAAAETSRIAIKHADLDLTSTAGKRTLALRIERAARAHCDTTSDYLGSEIRTSQAACRAEIKAKASAAVAQKMTVRLAAR
jgi:UrcA family protein